MATSSKKSSKSSSKKTSKYAGLKGDALKRKFFSQSPVGAQGLTVEQRVQGASVNRTKNADGSYSYSKPGKFVSDGKGGDSFQEFQGGAIPTDTMGATTPAVPTFQQQDMGFAGINTAMQTAAIPAEPLTPLETSQDNVTKLFQDYLGGKQDAFNNRESEQSLYNQAQRETGILAKQAEATRLQNQLGQIQAQGQANQLKVVGQGRGIPEAIIGGQQAQIGRETAIASLPVAASLAAAQGDLEMAQQNLETLFKIKSADAKAEFDYNTEVVQAVYNFGTAQEKAKLDEINKQEERRYQETLQLNQEAQSYAQMAFKNNQSKLGSQIASLDYKSPTFKADLAKLQSQLRDPVAELDRQLKNAQINQINAENAKATAIAKGEALTGKEKFIEGTFAARMEQANDFGVGFEEGTILKDGDYPSARDGAKFRAKGILPSELQDEKYKQYIQSQENFISAILRKESGAAISDEEYVREARKYYPQPGDGRDLIEQKRRTREISINGMKLASEGGYRVVKNSLDDVIKYAENGDIVIDDGGQQSNADFFGKPASSGFQFYRGDK